MSESVSNKTIVVDNNMFKYLEKYGFNVISLEEDNDLSAKTILEVNNLIKNNKIHYVFTTDQNNLNNTVKKIINNTGIKPLQFNNLSNITEAERSNNDNYITLLNKDIDLIKEELYN